MDQERSIITGIMLLVGMGLAMSLLFGWIIVHEYGLTVLYSSKAGQETILWFLICAGTIVYYLYLRVTHKDGIIEKAPGRGRREDPRELSLDLELPYRRAFDLAVRSFDSLPEGEVRSADPGAGIIEGWLPDDTLSGPGPAKITIKVQDAGMGKTRVRIHCITPHPTYQPVPLLIDRCFSRNERYVRWIGDYMKEPARQGDGTIV